MMENKKQGTSASHHAEPFCLALETRLLFPESEWPDWEHHEFKQGYLLTQVTLFGGAAGVEGELGLCIVPKSYEQDCWEGSSRAGEWDQWAFLSFITAPNPGGNLREKGATLTFFFGANTFFDRPLAVVKLLDVREDVATDLIFHTPWPPQDEELERSGRALVELLKRELGAIKVACPW